MLAHAVWPLDADRHGRAEGHGYAVLLRERGLDDLLLHLAVKPERDLPFRIALAQGNQRIVLRHDLQRRAELRHLPGIDRAHHALQCRERQRSRQRVQTVIWRSGAVPDASVPQAVQDGDITCRDALHRAARSGPLDAGHPRLNLLQQPMFRAAEQSEALPHLQACRRRGAGRSASLRKGDARS